MADLVSSLRRQLGEWGFNGAERAPGSAHNGEHGSFKRQNVKALACPNFSDTKAVIYHSTWPERETSDTELWLFSRWALT